MGRTAGSDSVSTFVCTIFEHDSILMVGHTGAVTKAHSTSSTTELGAQADGMQLGCTARRVSFRILLERAAAESLCAAEGLRARTHSGYKAIG